MNTIAVTPKALCNPLQKSVEIEYSFFSVIKPDNIEGTTLILKDSKGKLQNRKYEELSRGEIKKEKFTTAYFVSNKVNNLDFELKLCSEVMDVLMKAVIKCQISITEPVLIVQNNIHDISEDLAVAFSEQANNLLYSSKNGTLDIIQNLIHSLPGVLKETFTDYAKIMNCRLADIIITEEGKEEKINETVTNAIRSDDLITIKKHIGHVKEILDTKEMLLGHKYKVNRMQEEDQNKTLESKNKTIDLVTEKFQKLKETGMVSQGETSEEFRKSLNQIDSLNFGTGRTDSQASENKEKDKPTDSVDEKSYFE